MKDVSPAPNAIAKLWLIVLGVVLLAAGLFFAIGGAKLATLGGSWYFLVAGVAIVASGVLVILRRISGAILFVLVTLSTVVWALFDAGFHYWPLVSRLLAFGFAAAVVVATYPILARANGRSPAYAASLAIAALLLLGSLAGFAGMFVKHPPVEFDGKQAPLTPVNPAKEQTNWEAYGNTSAGTRFVSLDQITRDNVKDLKVAWTFRTGDVPLSPGNFGAEDQNTPLQVGNRLYVCTAHNNVIAISADDGKQVWKREFNTKSSIWMRCRGLAYYDSASASPSAPDQGRKMCETRIYMNTIDARLVSLDAETGELCSDFGDHGIVDLKAGMGEAADPNYVLTSAPMMAGSAVVVGGRVSDNVSTDMPGGVVRAFDAITGKLVWAFDPGNEKLKGEPAAGQTYTRSTPNVWAPMSYDPQLQYVFAPFGGPAPDIWGGKRTDLDHKYGASVVALDAKTGKENWVYQTVHNDLWDYDVPMQPTLIDFPMTDGQRVPAMVFGTKGGQIFVLDRRTGKPLTQVDEVPVKVGTSEGEHYSPTQPVSVGMPQIGTEPLSESRMWGMTPFDQLLCRIQFKSSRYDGMFTPTGTYTAIEWPGSLGGMNLGGVSVDPVNDVLIVNDLRVPLEYQLIKKGPDFKAAGGTGYGMLAVTGSPYAAIRKNFLSALGIPCQEPPYGTMTGINLRTRKIAWQVPVGTVEDTGPLGVKMHMPIEIGMPTLGGTLTTQGGVSFIAGTQDYYLRAFDTSTGEEIWKSRLPVGSQGGPMSYKSPKTGKQYIVISAGGGRNSPDRGDYVIAYALPD